MWLAKLVRGCCERRRSTNEVVEADGLASIAVERQISTTVSDYMGVLLR